MIPLLAQFFRELLFDKAKARRWTRALFLTFAAGGIGFADQLAALVNAPGAVKGIKIAAIVCFFLGGAVSVGEKNAKPGMIAGKDPP